MKSCEPNLSEESEYYVYSPSLLAKDIFFYVICTGHFLYEPGYSLYRDSYDSYLLLYIEEGSLILSVGNHTKKATAGNFVLLNCYEPHAYHTETGCRCLWCHLDGSLASGYYHAVTAKLGFVFSIKNALPLVCKMKAIYDMYSPGNVVKEPLVSKYLTDLFTSFLLSLPQKQISEPQVSESTIAYIKEHFREEINTGLLAERLGLSVFHFIRTFKHETGFTPHEYLIRTRIDTAKYLLKNTFLPVKDICFETGFSSESVFCSSFKKQVGLSPNAYRRNC